MTNEESVKKCLEGYHRLMNEGHWEQDEVLRHYFCSAYLNGAAATMIEHQEKRELDNSPAEAYCRTQAHESEMKPL